MAEWLYQPSNISSALTIISFIVFPNYERNFTFIYEFHREGKSSALNKDKREHRVDVQYNGD